MSSFLPFEKKCLKYPWDAFVHCWVFRKGRSSLLAWLTGPYPEWSVQDVGGVKGGILCFPPTDKEECRKCTTSAKREFARVGSGGLRWQSPGAKPSWGSCASPNRKIVGNRILNFEHTNLPLHLRIYLDCRVYEGNFILLPMFHPVSCHKIRNGSIWFYYPDSLDWCCQLPKPARSLKET